MFLTELFRVLIKIMCIITFFNVNNLTAQHNLLKGRILGLPNVNIYSIGIGYERIFHNKFSAQIIYNNHGYNWSNTDGGRFVNNSLITDYRFYFGQKETDLSKSLFTGFFTEFSKRVMMGSNEQFIEDGPTLIKEKQISVSPGVMLGFNIKLSNYFRLELLYGRKYRFIREQVDSRDSQGLFTEIEKYNRSGMRFELNLGYKF